MDSLSISTDIKGNLNSGDLRGKFNYDEFSSTDFREKSDKGG